MWSLCRYLNTFCGAGLLSARDLTHLDHEALISLGVTATGHRKRILRLVGHIQRTASPRDRSHSVTDRKSTVDFEAFRNSSAPNLAAMLAESESSSRTVVKPVPKPRTVFNRRRTTPVHFCPTPDPASPPHRRLSQESICFTVVEDKPSDNKMLTTSHRRQSQVQRTRPSRSLSLSDAGGVLPPVPPRLNRGTTSSVLQGSPSSSSSSSSPVQAEQNQSSSSLTPCLRGVDGSGLSGSSPSGSPGRGGLEMVSNEIYWGTLPGSAPSGGRSCCSQQSAPMTPPRLSTERHRSVLLLLYVSQLT